MSLEVAIGIGLVLYTAIIIIGVAILQIMDENKKVNKKIANLQARCRDVEQAILTIRMVISSEKTDGLQYHSGR